MLVDKVVSIAPTSSDAVITRVGKFWPDFAGGAPDGWNPRPSVASDVAGGKFALDFGVNETGGKISGPPVASDTSCPDSLPVLGAIKVLVIGCDPQSVQVSTAFVKPYGIGVGVGKYGREDIPT